MMEVLMTQRKALVRFYQNHLQSILCDQIKNKEIGRFVGTAYEGRGVGGLFYNKGVSSSF